MRSLLALAVLTACGIAQAQSSCYNYRGSLSDGGQHADGRSVSKHPGDEGYRHLKSSQTRGRKGRHWIPAYAGMTRDRTLQGRRP